MGSSRQRPKPRRSSLDVGFVVISSSVTVEAPPATVFSLLRQPGSLGWLFGAEADELRVGGVMRLNVPLPRDKRDGAAPAVIKGAARIIDLVEGKRIVLAHEVPWAGKVTLRFEPSGARGTLVRLIADIDHEEIDWMARRQGGAPPAQPTCATRDITIGLLTTLSGTAGVFGRAAVNCAQLAIEELNADGGLLGLPVRLAVGDDATSPTVGVAEARRLIETERAQVLIACHTSETFNAVRHVSERYRILYLYPQVNEGGPQGRFAFRFGETPADQLRTAIPSLMKEVCGRNWFLVGSDYCWPRQVNGTARQIVDEAKGRVVGERYLPLGEQQFEPLLIDIERSSAEMVVTSMIGWDAVAFERAFYAAGLRGRIRTIGVLIDETTRELIGDAAATGIWSIFGYFMALPGSAATSFLERYRAAFGQVAPPVSNVSESVYEAVHLYARAASRARSTESTAVSGRLVGSSFKGPRGKVRIRPDGSLQMPLYLAEAVTGGFEVQRQIVAFS